MIRQPENPMKLVPIALQGSFVRLEPLSREHLPGLIAVGLAPELWALTVDRIRTAEDLTRYVERALKDAADGTAMPYATIWTGERGSGKGERDKPADGLSGESGTVIGSTRFGNLALAHRRAEIGWTWLGLQWQRTAANTEAKLLMLTHGFEVLGLRRIEFKTSTLNLKSRAALVRIGAVEEGIFRQHMINDDGSNRDSVYFSILDSEWPGVRQRLEVRLGFR
jgi:RimJ/RimL family protein N-acetyltransferase